MQQRRLGSRGPTVSALGLGCMSMSEFYGPRDDGESVATLHRALDLGVDFFDTANAYGPHLNEVLVGKALRGRRPRYGWASLTWRSKDSAMRRQSRSVTGGSGTEWVNPARGRNSNSLPAAEQRVAQLHAVQEVDVVAHGHRAR